MGSSSESSTYGEECYRGTGWATIVAAAFEAALGLKLSGNGFLTAAPRNGVCRDTILLACPSASTSVCHHAKTRSEQSPSSRDFQWAAEKITLDAVAPEFLQD